MLLFKVNTWKRISNIAKKRARKCSLKEPCSKSIQRNVRKDKRWCFNTFLFSVSQSNCISATVKIHKDLKIMWNQKKLKLNFVLGRQGDA